MVDENIFGFVWQSFEVIKVLLTSIKISFGGATVNLLQFSLGIIVFGVVMGLFINYTKKESASDAASAALTWYDLPTQRGKREKKKIERRWKGD